MIILPPKIDERTAPEIVEEVYHLLPMYVEQWPGRTSAGELANAIVHVFGRFSEIVIDRLNKAPQKNFFAFLNLLGVSPLPLQPARAPVTFYMAAGNASHAWVPKGSQIAAPPPPGAQKPIIFETERDLVVVNVNLSSVILKDGGNDRCIDYSAMLAPPAVTDASEATTAQPVVAAVVPIPHMFYVSLPPFPVWPPESETRLKFVLESEPEAPKTPRVLQWELCTKQQPKAKATGTVEPVHVDDPVQVNVLAPLFDSTDNLTKSGDVIFSNLPDVNQLVVDDVVRRWLRCRLLTPMVVSSPPSSSKGSLPAQAPTIQGLTIATRVARGGLKLDAAFFNTLKLDTTKDFFPFGEKPKFGDTLYIASGEAFSSASSVVTIHVDVTTPASGSSEKSALPPARPQDTQLLWEFWDGTAWVALGTSEISRVRVSRIRIGTEGPEPSGETFSDTTLVFSDSGLISFRFPKAPAQLNVNGQKNYWLRVRIIAGDYGKEAQLREGVIVPANFAAPSIHAINIDYELETESQPDTVLTYNDFSYARIDPSVGPFQPFVPLPSGQLLPSLYFGFSLPPNLPVFPHQPISAYVAVADSDIRQDGAEPDSVTATWEYSKGLTWKKLTVLDDTQGLRRSGIVVVEPADFALANNFGLSLYWLRTRRDDSQFQPQLSQVLLNTTMAVQGATIANEILGASNGTPEQKFRSTQAPVLAGERVEVRESTKPSHAEWAHIVADEGSDAIVQVSEPAGKGVAFWIRWHEVPTFFGSGPRDRHYQLDRMTGEVRFGDGTNGMIPPPLPGNVRCTYRTGGGTAGNLPANSIQQLKSAIPYVQKAGNVIAATGGTDAEPDSAILSRGPLEIRHGGRAVTREDFEDLAMLASREVARARCVPLFDLSEDPDARHRKSGVISLILVPRSSDLRPRPSQDLLGRVRSYIDARRQLTAELQLVRPEYIRVDVDCEVTVIKLERAGEVEEAIKSALRDYLHPVNGGNDGTGWDFGREPRRSDLFALLESMPGISHVRELKITLLPERAGSRETRRFLIYSGEHKVTATLAE